MFWRQKISNFPDVNMLENIKSEIETQLGNKGVVVSEINMQITPENISLSIYINNCKRFA